MKTKTTLKNIRNNWKKVFRTGYCDLQYIMKNHEADYYNSGVYGWNCDIYVDYSLDIAITTGYRGMFGRTIPESIIEKHTNIAKEIINDTDWSTQLSRLDENRKNFFEEINKL